MKTAAKMVGKIERTERNWEIICEPHVLMRLKRIFERIDKSEHGTVTLTDTPENAHDLEWTLVRYPMAVHPRDLAYLAERAEEHRHRMALIAAVLQDDYQPQAFELALPARQYQALAADLWLRCRALLLADDVGIGKTLSAICALTEPRTRPALVVTLAHLPRQWAREVEKFAPSLRTHILRGTRPYLLTKGRRGGLEPFPDVIIASYHKLGGWADTLAPIVRTLVFDECQELRRGEGDPKKPSKKYAAALHLAQHAEYRIGLSATPIYNYGNEMWNVFSVLQPDALGTRGEFGREWCDGSWGKTARIKAPRVFGRYLREQGLMLRRTRGDVGRELPALSRIPQEIDADVHVLERVQTTVTELARIILAQGQQVRGQKLRASEELSYLLRQATGIAKAPYVAAFVRMLVESGERVVLYGWHHEVYAIWRQSLKDLYPVFYTGKESPTEKDNARRRFTEGQRPVLIMSLRAGAGLDGLQHHSRTVVFGELDWSPGVHEQCIGRVFRDGQKDPVFAYFLIAESGSDPVVADVLGLKTQQIEGLRDPDAELLERLEVDQGHIRRLAEEYLRKHGPPTQTGSRSTLAESSG